MWTCPNCSQLIDDNLGTCWQCGSTPEGAKDPNFKQALLERDNQPDDAAFLAKYRCPKCGHDGAELETVRAASGLLSKLLHVETARFEAVTCTRCRYTELYKADRSALRDIFALIAG